MGKVLGFLSNDNTRWYVDGGALVWDNYKYHINLLWYNWRSSRTATPTRHRLTSDRRGKFQAHVCVLKKKRRDTDCCLVSAWTVLREA
jgi:hypothetical protein